MSTSSGLTDNNTIFTDFCLISGIHTLNLKGKKISSDAHYALNQEADENSVIKVDEICKVKAFFKINTTGIKFAWRVPRIAFSVSIHQSAGQETI